MSNSIFLVGKDSKFSLKRFNENVKRRNKRFKKLDRMAQRVTIAKDVLNLLDIRKLRASRGVYVQLPHDAPLPRPEDSCEVQFAKAENCTVCALGAVFLGAVGRGAVECNNLWNDDDSMRTMLRPYFTTDELWRMEHYFESGYVMGDDARLRAVMEAVIKSKGEKVVPDGITDDSEDF